MIENKLNRYISANLSSRGVPVCCNRFSLHGGYSSAYILSFPFLMLIHYYKRSGHLQTLYCVIGDFSKVDKVEYDR